LRDAEHPGTVDAALPRSGGGGGGGGGHVSNCCNRAAASVDFCII